MPLEPFDANSLERTKSLKHKIFLRTKNKIHTQKFGLDGKNSKIERAEKKSSSKIVEL